MNDRAQAPQDRTAEPVRPTRSTRSARPTTTAPRRRELIADTALALLAERGMRGLTHRAVDEAAGLPQGSTSNLARTRAALLETAVTRLAERDAALLPSSEADAGTSSQGPPAPDALADLLAHALHRSLTHHRELLIARYELALEATRRPELRAVYDRAGRTFRDALAALLTAAGSPAPERHARTLLAWSDGVLFSCTAGQLQGAAPSRTELHSDCAELLQGMLGPGARPDPGRGPDHGPAPDPGPGLGLGPGRGPDRGRGPGPDTDPGSRS